MGKFEQVPTNNQKPEQPKDSEHWGKKLRKVFAVASIGLAGQFLNDTKVAELPMQNKIEESKVPEAEKEISFDGLKDIFSPEIQIVGKSVIFQIDQWHDRDGDLEKTRRGPGGIEKVIESQKNVEKAIRFLIVKYGIRDFYVETIKAEHEKGFTRLLSDIAHFKAEIAAGKADAMLRYIEIINQQRLDFKIDSTKNDGARGQLTYFLLCRVNDVLAARQNGLIKFDEGDVKKLQDLRSEMEKDPTIENGKSYLWGAAFMMLAQGEIVIHQIEDEVFNAQVGALMERLNTTNPNNKEEVAFLEKEIVKNQNLREDAMVDFVLKFLKDPNRKGVGVVLGGSHYLVGNLRAKKAPGIGLIKLHNIVDDRFIEELVKNPKYSNIEIRDEADLREK